MARSRRPNLSTPAQPQRNTTYTPLHYALQARAFSGRMVLDHILFEAPRMYACLRRTSTGPQAGMDIASAAQPGAACRQIALNCSQRWMGGWGRLDRGHRQPGPPDLERTLDSIRLSFFLSFVLPFPLSTGERTKERNSQRQKTPRRIPPTHDICGRSLQDGSYRAASTRKRLEGQTKVYR